MRLRSIIVALAVTLLAPATTVSASEWAPARAYDSIAVSPDDAVRYGGYTGSGRASIDVLDPRGAVHRTIQPPTVEGRDTRMIDLATAGDLLVASYELATNGSESGDPGYFGLALYRDGQLVGSGTWARQAYLATTFVALNAEWVLVDSVDSGSTGSIHAFTVDDLARGSLATDDNPSMEPRDAAEWEYPDTPLALSDSAFYLHRIHDHAVEVYSLPPDPELVRTIQLDEAHTLDMDLGVDGGFVVSGDTTDPRPSCSIWTHGEDGSFEDCFLPDARARDLTFDVDGCGGIVVADRNPEDGLRGHKLIPSDRDRGCFVDARGSMFASNVAAIGRSGVSKGCNPPDNDRFCPDDLVTRGEMAAFLVRAMAYTDTDGGDHFVDDDHSMFEHDIDKLRAADVTKGCNPPDNNRFCPDDPVTRGEMAAFLDRALGA